MIKFKETLYRNNKRSVITRAEGTGSGRWGRRWRGWKYLTAVF